MLHVHPAGPLHTALTLRACAGAPAPALTPVHTNCSVLMAL